MWFYGIWPRMASLWSLPGRAWRALHRRRAYFTVEPILFLFMFSAFLSYPSFQELLREMVCQHTPNCTSSDGNASSANSSSDSECGDVSSEVDRAVQSETSHWILYANLARGLPSILVSILFGSLSDQMGRRFFLALPAIGMIFNMAVILQVIYIQSLTFGYLLFGSFAAGTYGGFAVMNFAAYSYTSDISTHRRRTVMISILESMTYIGAAASQVIGGLWIKDGYFAPPFWLILSCSVVIILYIILALPESLDPSMVRRRYPRPSCVRLMRAVSQSLLEFGKLLLSSWKLSVLMFMFFVVEINFLGITDIVILYTTGEPFCWGYDLVGYFLALKVLLNGLAALFVLPFLVRLSVPDTGIIMTGLLAGGSALVLMGMSFNTWMLFVVPVVAAMRGCVVPCIRSMLSKLVPPDKQGVLFSGVSVVESACILVASVLYNALYPATRQINRGFCFYLMAACLLLPFMLTLLLHAKRDRPERDPESPNHLEREPLLRAPADGHQIN